MISVIFFGPSRDVLGKHLKKGNNHFFPSFPSHYSQSPCHSCCTSYSAEKALLKTKKWLRHEHREMSYQYVKDIPLVDMNSDKCFKFSTFNFCEVSSSLVNKRVEQLQELVVSISHYLLVCPSLHQSRFSISSPDHLNAQNTNLKIRYKSFISFCWWLLKLKLFVVSVCISTKILAVNYIW